MFQRIYLTVITISLSILSSFHRIPGICVRFRVMSSFEESVHSVNPSVSKLYALLIRYYLEDSGIEVERRPLVPKVPGSNPAISGFCLWDFSTQTARVLVKFRGSRHRA